MNRRQLLASLPLVLSGAVFFKTKPGSELSKWAKDEAERRKSKFATGGLVTKRPFLVNDEQPNCCCFVYTIPLEEAFYG